MKLKISQFTPRTQVEGPGLRACIQVQGCPIKCVGCGVPHTWSKNGGRLVDAKELIDEILADKSLNGVTFLGGEPFAQAAELAFVGREVKAQGLSVVTFTGYLIEDIRKAKRNDYNELLAVTDMLIDGPFQKKNTEFSRPWVGSSNQRYHFLTNRYLHLEPTLASIPNRIEVRMKPDGRILINGLTPLVDMKSLIN